MHVGKTYPSCDIDCAVALEKEILANGADSIAAFIAEPMMGIERRRSPAGEGILAEDS